MKIFMLACTMLLTMSASASDCPYQKPYKCKLTGYSQYQCGCGVEWSGTRVGKNSNPNLYLVNAPVINIQQPYTPPRYISYGDNQTVYKLLPR